MNRYKSFYEDSAHVFLQIDSKAIETISSILQENPSRSCYAYYLGDSEEFNFYLDNIKINLKANKLSLKRDEFNYVSIPFNKIHKVEYSSTLEDGVMEVYVKNKRNPIVINFIF